MDTAPFFARPNIITLVMCLTATTLSTNILSVQCLSLDTSSTSISLNSGSVSVGGAVGGGGSEKASGTLLYSTGLATNSTSFSGAPPSLVLTSNITARNVTANNTTNGYIIRRLCECEKGKFSDPESYCQCEGPLVDRISQYLDENLHRLVMKATSVWKLRKMGLKKYKLIEEFVMQDCAEFVEIEVGAFGNLTHLRTIDISGSPKLQTFPAEVFLDISKLFKILRIVDSGLVNVPDLSLLGNIDVLDSVDLSRNRITTLKADSFNLKTIELVLSDNPLTSIDSNAFRGSEIKTLNLEGNRQLVTLQSEAFSGIRNIVVLNLSKTGLKKIPHAGLQTLEELRIENTHSLKTIPSVLNFPSLQEAWLTHSFHCCAFKYPMRHDPAYYAERQREKQKIQQKCAESSTKPSPVALGPTDRSSEENMWGDPVDSLSDVIDTGLNQNHKPRLLVKRVVEEIVLQPIDEDNFGAIEPETGNDNEEWTDQVVDGHEEEQITLSTVEEDNWGSNDANVAVNRNCMTFSKDRSPVKCFPVPDALNPCEDVMGSNWLRGSVWIVAFLAVFGNVLVLVVLLGARGELTVFKFLMCNLAWADLCMGLYLFLLACIDVHSIEEYFNFAYDWQYGAGCTVAGVLTNFASHLSVFTLTIITLERSFAITNAINLNKRLGLGTTVKIMLCGWIYSIIMACLPLVGMSNYSSTSICLPMEARDWVDVSYLVSLILTNGVAFTVIVVCYVQIYYSLGRDTRKAEIKIAQKMALLVFTNFVCWAPIAFFATTALAGYPLIDVAKSKILLVFFYPLNSCANPYLYAIMTAQYRKDLFHLLSKFGLCRERAHKYKMSISTNIPLIERLPSKTTSNGGGTETGSAQILRKESGESYL